MSAVVTLVSPLPANWYLPLWDWLHEAPAANFDDEGPQTIEAFLQEIVRRQKAGERSWGVEVDGVRVGAINYTPLTKRVGTGHFVFTQAVYGTGVARLALFQVFDELFASGVEKIVGQYFVDNERVHRFLKHIGFTEEGLLRDHAVRNGVPVSMRAVALFRPDHPAGGR